ncbi:nitrite/sulfite reductase [Jonesia quinghaiensis]|uniref:nitrite/sulfite reductase n=1 Tax=Jonesia quinghaiensis TaxID=262806 RepID=UPI00048A444B|nr:nitrite/sulfite reductase [Jonesia quinghaiensis]
MTASHTPARPQRPARAAKPQGQWKVDGTTPLNANEEFKQQDNGLNVRDRIIETYARQGFDSIPTEDLHGRFRWWGLYTQRKPGIDGGRTATLEPHELEDKYFMMRVRIDGGSLTTTQLRVIGDISVRYARDSADISDRQNVQYHWIQVEDVPAIWEELEANGLHTTEACGDVPRVVLGSPVAGIADDELIDVTPFIDTITQRFIGDPELANLPRKFKTAMTGHPSQDVVHEINDVSFVAVNHPELGIGFDVWVGGGLSTVAHMAKRLGAFVAPDQVADVWHGVVQIFRDYGYRRLRNRARLKFLMADWGPEKFREILETEYLGYALPDGPAPQSPTRPGDHVGVHRQKDGLYYVGAAPYVGRVSGSTLVAVADLAESVGSHRVRLTPHQKLLILDVPEEHITTLTDGLRDLGLSARPSPFRRNTMACTGIEYCKLAIVETKATATRTIQELEERLGDVEHLGPIRLHVNGCPNSCARIQTADIGLKGQLVMDDDGNQVPGFQVHLGGGLASDTRAEAGTGRTVRGLKVTADELTGYVERLVHRFEDARTDGETFGEWTHRAQEDELR